MREHISNISEETKYYSFMIAQSDQKQVAEKWQYHILSCEGQLLMSSEQNKNNKKYQYNISIDTISCQFDKINNYKFILAEGDWLKSCLTIPQLIQLSNLKILHYDTLQISQLIHFYYYIKNNPFNFYSVQKLNQQNDIIDTKIQNNKQLIYPININFGSGQQFIQIIPKYLLMNDCLIFQLFQTHKMGQMSTKKSNIKQSLINKQKILATQHFKIFSKHNKIINNKPSIMYNFKSQYALLSDQHFLNCFIRGKKSIGSYIKVKENIYQFQVDQEILDILDTITFVYPRL